MTKLTTLGILILQLLFVVNCAVNGTETPNPSSTDSSTSPIPTKSKIEVLVDVVDDSNTKEHFPDQLKGASSKIDVSGIAGENKIGFIRFDLSEFKKKDEVTRAEIVVWVRDVKDIGRIDLNLVTGSWTEGSLTYNSLDALALIPIRTIGFDKSHKNREVRLDVTMLVQNWINKNIDNNGIALSPHVTTDGELDSVQVEFFSKESPSHPIYLEIEVNR